MRSSPLLALVLVLAGAGGVRAQAAPASPFLPQDHWVMEALRRIEPAHASPVTAVRGRRSVTRAEAVSALRAAAARDGAAAEAAGRVLERFLEEFPTAGRNGAEPVALELSPLLGVERREGELWPGTGYGRDGIPYAAPVPGEDLSDPVAGIRVSVQGGSRWAVLADGGWMGGEWTARSLHGVVGAGPLLFWGGRRPVGYGPGEGGGLVFGDAAVVDGAGLQLAVPLVGPSVLRYLGPVHFETFFSRTDDSGPADSPWLWGARGSIRPHPRLTLGINRGAMFGGENVETTFQDLVYILIGKHAGMGSSVENQIVSVDAVYRLPLALASEAYVEWGFEDSAGAWKNVPGVLLGVSAWDLPGLPGVRVGVERTEFVRACCGNPIWYRHMFLLGGWTQDRRPLGHPLGGHGAEWLVYGSGGFFEERLQLRGSVAFRDRRLENLYAPTRVGRSQAGRLSATWRQGRWGVDVELASEAAAEWSETRLRTAARVTF